MTARPMTFALLWCCATAALALPPVEVTVASFGRLDALVWSIADTDGYPNILSELAWTDLAVAGLEIAADARVADAIEARGRLRAGWILAGSNRDSDYAHSDRQSEYSRSNNDASGGLVWDASLGAGYRFGRGRRVSALVLAGMEVAQQRLRMSDGFQTIPPLGPFPGLDSRYIATWWGPWLGAEASLDLGGRSFTSLAASYHLPAYYAWADWNLRPDFAHPKSFEHRAWGQALRASTAFETPIRARASLSLRAEAAFAAFGPGADRTFGSDGSVGYTQLNGVWWWSFGGAAGVRFAL